MKTKKRKVGTVHNYLKTYMGHDYTFAPYDGGYKAKMSGWGDGIHKDDLLLIGQPPEIAFYRIDSIRYVANPTDMWFATVTFVPHSYGEMMKRLKEMGLDPAIFA